MINSKPLIKFLLWILTLLLICMIGITGVCADTTDIGYISNDTQVLISIPNAGAPITLNQNTSINNSSVNALWFNINYNFQKDKLYQLEISTPDAKLVNINTFGIEYNGGVCNFYGYSDANIGYPKIYFKCLQNVNYLSISFKNWDNNTIVSASNFKWSYTFLRILSDDETIDLGPVISNQNQNTQDIINNQNTNNQNIINNNNANTDKIIEENNKNFNTCRDSYNLLNITATSTNSASGLSITVNDDKSITVNGTNASSSTYFFRLAPNITLPAGTYTLSNGYTNASYNTILFYDDNGNIPANGNVVSKTFSSSVTISPYIRVGPNQTINNITIYPMIQKGSTATDYEEYGKEICTNKLDAQKDAIDNVDSTLKDDSVDENGVADAFDSFNDFLDDNSTITQLITLPITLYTAILNNLNGTCSPFNLGQLYGEDLILPCINISQYLGNSLWTMIDIIISGFAVYAISRKMIKVFNNFSSLREGDVIDD